MLPKVLNDVKSARMNCTMLFTSLLFSEGECTSVAMQATQCKSNEFRFPPEAILVSGGGVPNDTLQAP